MFFNPAYLIFMAPALLLMLLTSWTWFKNEN
jgi:hypothetical protein